MGRPTPCIFLIVLLGEGAIIAPQHQQVTDLALDGFISAQTVSAFVARGKMSLGSVVIVDEAGQIGGEQMEKLLSLVKEHDGRIILSGDTRQHGAVEASDALRVIEKYGAKLFSQSGGGVGKQYRPFS